MSANDRQEGGDHYIRLDPEPWDVIEAWGLDFFLGNALKYISRAGSATSKARLMSDLSKAAHYLEKAREIEGREEWPEPAEMRVPENNRPSDIPKCPYCGFRGEHSMACPAWQSSDRAPV